MPTLDTLVARLTSDGLIQDSEAIADSKLEQWITEALRKHSPQYSATTLPAEEVEAVVILARVELCFHRAQVSVDQPDTVMSGGGMNLGANRDNPYRRNMDLAARLLDRYNSLVGGNADAGQNTITQGVLRIANPQADDRLSGPPKRITVTLQVGEDSITSDEVVLQWSHAFDEGYQDIYIFTGTDADFWAEWRLTKVLNVPHLATDAELVIKTPDQSIRAIKVTELTAATDYYFVAVLSTRRGSYYASPVLKVTTAA